jgi:hypothetical protein
VQKSKHRIFLQLPYIDTVLSTGVEFDPVVSLSDNASSNNSKALQETPYYDNSDGSH